MMPDERHNSEPSVERDATTMAEKLCLGLGYERPDLVAFPLMVLSRSLQLDKLLSLEPLQLQNAEGENVESGTILPILEKSIGANGVMNAEFHSNDLGAFVSPANQDSWLSQMILSLNNNESRVAMRLPTFDLVNGKALRELIQFDNPVCKIEIPTQIFNRFSTEILGDYDVRWPQQGLPRVTITNGYRRAGNHLSMTIEVPDKERHPVKVFQLLVTREREEERELARGILRLFQESPIRYVQDPMLDLATEAAKIALEQGYYPYGAVLQKDDGSMVVARNDAKSNGHLHHHAEYLAMSQEKDPSHALGTLYSNTEPCHSCCQQIFETDVRQVFFALEQAEEWQGRESLHKLLNTNNHRVYFSQEPQMIMPNLQIMEDASRDTGRFPGQFAETIAINSFLYEEWAAQGMPTSFQWKKSSNWARKFRNNFN